MSASNRNQPCPCNSGKKFKRCCGSAEAIKAKEQAQFEARLAQFRKNREAQKAKEEVQGATPSPRPRPRIGMMGMAMMLTTSVALSMPASEVSKTVPHK